MKHIEAIVSRKAARLLFLALVSSLLLYNLVVFIPQVQAQDPLDQLIEKGAPVPAGKIQTRPGGGSQEAVSAQGDISAQATFTASVLVNFGENKDTIIRDAGFSTPTVTGLQALQASGLNIVTTTTSFGTAICAIGGVGCPASDCFCKCNGTGPCLFWSYNFWDGSDWTAHSTGVDGSTVDNGDIEGYTWGGTLPAPAPYLGGQKAINWLRTQQNTDGGYPFVAPGSSSMGITLEVLMIAGINHLDPTTWRLTPGDTSLLDYVKTNGQAYAGTNPASAGKLAVALAAVGQNPKTAISGFDLAAKIESYYDSAQGLYVGTGGSKSNWDQAFAILGLRAAQAFEVTPTAVEAQAVIQKQAVQNLKNRQVDGGWDFAGTGGAPDTNSTALVIQALVAGGIPINDSAIVAGLDFLENAQNSNGGFPYTPPGDSDVNSTGYVAQGLIAANENLSGSPWSQTNTPIGFILSLQQSNGSIYYQPGDPGFSLLLATTQATPPLFNKAFPLNTGPLGRSLNYFPVILKKG